MDDMTKFLRRANLKELACCFTNLDLPIEEDLPPDRTVEELSDAARWGGLLDGMRVGARLVLSLTGGAPPVC